MLGQFVIPTCHAAGLSATAFLRNTVRIGEEVPLALREKGMDVELRVYERGKLVFRDEHFGHVPLGGALQLSEETCPALGPSDNERVIVARCALSDGTEAPFAQEHQLMYHVRATGVFDSLLYDQFPVVAPNPQKPPSPIVLIAPKIWVGREHTAFVTFSNTTGGLDVRAQSVPLEISVLNSAGAVVATQSVTENENSTLVVDARKLVGGRVPLRADPEFFTMIARGGASFYAIVTFVQNTATGNFAIEHSLSPHYYITGDMGRMRREALKFPSASR